MVDFRFLGYETRKHFQESFVMNRCFDFILITFRRTFLVSLPSLFLLNMSYAQVSVGTVEGRVLFSDGQPAPFASYICKTAKLQGIADHKGEFTLKNVSSGNHVLTFHVLGHERKIDSIRVVEGQITHLTSTLNLRSNELDEVIITGQSEPMTLKNSVYQVRTISAEKIRLRGATNLPTLLNTELGIRFRNDMALGTNDIELLGLSGQNVKILLDGIPLLDRGAIRESLGQIDIHTIERIEIVEGPMSVIYGTDALAGVINLITKKGTETQSLAISARIQEESARNEYRALKGDGVHNQSMNVTWKSNPWQASAGISTNSFGGWQGGLLGRAKRWMPKEQLLFNASLGYQKNKMTLWYRINGTDEELKSLGNSILRKENGREFFGVTDKKYTTWRLFHQLQGDFALSEKLSVIVTGAYTDYTRKTRTTNTNLNTGQTTLSPDAGSQDKNTFNSIFGRTLVNYKIDSRTVLIGGVEYNHNETIGPRIQGKPQITDYAVFITPEFKLANGKINLRPGVRLVKNSVYKAPPAVPSLNTKFSLSPKTDLRIGFAQGYRAPILQELYFWFFDASHSIKGNPNLRAESSNSFNLFLNHAVFQKKEARLTVVLGGFYNQFKDRISEAKDIENPAQWTYFNLYRFKTTGASINTSLTARAFQSNLGFQWTGIYNQYAEIPELNLPNFNWTPELNLNLIYTLAPLKTSVNVAYKFTGKRPLHEQSATAPGGVQKAVTSSFQMADLAVNKSVGRFLMINGGVRNILDVTNLTNTSSDTGGAHSAGNSVPMSYGRSYFLGLSVNWYQTMKHL
jgi:outer membrane receptor for ferrienterochelin and colicins